MNGIRIALTAAVAFAAPHAHAQEAWPSRTVRVIVTSSPGGGTDTFARLMAQGLSQSLKQQFVVENRAGASGNIGAEMVAKATPDGYTVLVSSSPSLVINPSLYKNLPYNAERDFVPVARGVISPLVWVVHPSVPAKSLGELAAIGKREPGKLPYGSAGAGSLTNLGVRLFEDVSGARYLHVPFKGLGNAYPSLLAGEVKIILSDIGTALPHIHAGKVVALAVTERLSQLPGVPTVAEAGFANTEASGWFSVAMTAGTPPAIVQRLSAEINRAMKTPGIAEKLEQQVLIPVFDTPEVFAAALKKEREKWAALIQRLAIQPDQ
jgi:tripartite-type tricarboxylate transporter receptor subunit TctC